MKMKYVKITAAIITAVLILGTNTNVFSLGLFKFFSDTYSVEGLKKIETMDPDKDILYLPQLKNKELFKSVRDLSICREKSVRKYIYMYLTQGREYMIRSIEGANKYMEIMKPIFKKEKDIPIEVAFLPLLESGFSPWAVSRTKATGMWQFTYNTSQIFGMKINNYVDERRNVEKSTKAAIRHLRYLKTTFKTWDLVLAAYNGGGGYVRRAMNKSGAKNIWQLREAGVLKWETNEYVPRYLAMLVIYRNQWLFGLKDEIKKTKSPNLGTITLPYTVPLENIAKLSNISVKDILKHNPELNKGVLPPGQKNYIIKLPEENADILMDKIKELYPKEFSSIEIHIIKKGETLGSIAKIYNSSSKEIKYINNIASPRHLKAGCRLIILSK